MRRFQGDAQWQADFRSLAQAVREQKAHAYASKRLHDEGRFNEAGHELALAYEAQERIELLEHALKDFR